MKESFIEIEHLKKYYESSRVRKGEKRWVKALDDVTLSIPQGKLIGVVGESGCGKSTLGRVIIHLLQPTEGKIFFEGEDISNPSKARLKELRKDMQMIFQETPSPPSIPG